MVEEFNSNIQLEEPSANETFLHAELNEAKEHVVVIKSKAARKYEL